LVGWFVIYPDLPGGVSESLRPSCPQGRLGYLLALAIYDNVFATGLRDVEEVYRIEIPPHVNDVKLEVKGTKLNLPIFRRPAYPVNQFRNLMTIGLLRDLCAITAIITTSPVLGT
jgi:hypothetical protein